MENNPAHDFAGPADVGSGKYALKVIEIEPIGKIVYAELQVRCKARIAPKCDPRCDS